MLAATVVAALLVCQSPVPALTAFTESRAESLRYRFENPSRLDTADLVPHFFEQTYDTDHVWVGAAVRHRLFGTNARFEIAATPSATRQADDFDTFYQPNGNVVVSGTTGNATLRAFSVAGRVDVGRWRAFLFGLEYLYRRDRAEFHDGDGSVTTTIPPSETHRVVTTRETTVSQLHAVNWIAEVERRRGAHLGTIELRAAPVALGRLTVDLPDKYPGEVLAYHAKVATLEVLARYEHAAGAWGIGGFVRAGRTFNWTTGGQLHLAGASVGLSLRRRL